MGRLDSLNHTAVGVSRLSPFARNVYLCARMDALQSLGNVQRAREIASRVGLQSGGIRVSEARLNLIAGRTENTLNLVKAAQHDEGMFGPDRASLELLEAAAHLQLAQPLEASAAVEAALRRMCKMRSLVPFCAITRGMRAQLTELAVDGALWAELATAVHLTESELRARIDGLAQSFPEIAVLVDLTPREVRMVELLDAGATQTEMANSLSLSLSAVKKQVAGLYRTLGVASRSGAMRAAYEMRLLESPRVQGSIALIRASGRSKGTV